MVDEQRSSRQEAYKLVGDKHLPVAIQGITRHKALLHHMASLNRVGQYNGAIIGGRVT